VASASGILASDILPSGESGIISLNSTASHGTVVVNADGSFSYTPNTGYAGSDSFTYKVTDTNGQTAIATVTLNVQAGAVTATANNYTAQENQALSVSAASGVLATDILPAGETGTASLNSAASNGTVVVNADGSFSYTPNTGYAGTDSFTYKVTDSNGQTAIATVNLNVQAGAVTATADTYTAQENQTLSISTTSGVLASDILPSGESGTIALNSAASHGTVVMNADGSFSYTPTTGFAGTDSFTYKVTDSNGQIAIATVTLNVQAESVTATADTYTAQENQPLSVISSSGLLATDILPSGETGLISLNTGASHGTVVVYSDGSFTYVPTTGYAGTDSFTYKVTDTNGQSVIATVTLNVQAGAVTATGDTYTANENQALSITAGSGVLASDILQSGESGTIALNTGASNGTVVVNADGSFSYTPNTGYAGTDSFTYKVTDTNGQTAIGAVTLNVQAASISATNAEMYSAKENQSLVVNASSGVLNSVNIPAGESATAALYTAPLHGDISFNADGSFTYTPNSGYAGRDSFTYTITDTNGQTTTEVATINVQKSPAKTTSNSAALSNSVTTLSSSQVSSQVLTLTNTSGNVNDETSTTLVPIANVSSTDTTVKSNLILNAANQKSVNTLNEDQATKLKSEEISSVGLFALSQSQTGDTSTKLFTKAHSDTSSTHTTKHSSEDMTLHSNLNAQDETLSNTAELNAAASGVVATSNPEMLTKLTNLTQGTAIVHRNSDGSTINQTTNPLTNKIDTSTITTDTNVTNPVFVDKTNTVVAFAMSVDPSDMPDEGHQLTGFDHDATNIQLVIDALNGENDENEKV
jgi:hypothetical protein